MKPVDFIGSQLIIANLDAAIGGAFGSPRGYTSPNGMRITESFVSPY